MNRAAQENAKPARITYAEELIFPDFQLRIPLFAKDADKAYWLQKVSAEVGRASISGDFLSYKVTSLIKPDCLDLCIACSILNAKHTLFCATNSSMFVFVRHCMLQTA